MNWDNLKVALAVARAGSLSRGATLLGIDQSTAGRRLSALEAEVGTILFARSKSGFLPTDAGKAVIDRALEIELQVNGLTEDVLQKEQGPAGTVRLLGNCWVLDRLTRHVLPEFLASHPLICVRMISRPPHLPIRGDATVSLWFEVTPRQGEFAVRLGQVPYALYVKKGTDPDTAPWVSFFDEDTPRRAPVRAWERLRRKGDRHPCLTATDAINVHSAVRAGIGKGLLPMCLAQGDDEIVRVTAGAPDLQRVLDLHAHPDTVQANRLQALIQVLRRTFHSTFSTSSLKSNVATLSQTRSAFRPGCSA